MVTSGPCTMLKRTDPRYRRFRFDAGGLSLNFVATVRHRGSQPRDLLTTPESLLRWFERAGLASTPSSCSREDYEESLLLREAIHDTMRSLILNRKPGREDVDGINNAARFPISVPRLNGSADRILWDRPDSVKECLAIIARDAITLMGEERHRLKMCNSDRCRMLFLDCSPGNRRRWCAMSICGNRSKVARHRERLGSVHGTQISAQAARLRLTTGPSNRLPNNRRKEEIVDGRSSPYVADQNREGNRPYPQGSD